MVEEQVSESPKNHQTGGQAVFSKRSVYVLVSRGLSMFRGGLTGPEMTFLDDFC